LTPQKLKSKPLKGLSSEPPTQTSDVYLNEVIGELERAYSLASPINLFIKLPDLMGITASTYSTEVHYVTLRRLRSTSYAVYGPHNMDHIHFETFYTGHITIDCEGEPMYSAIESFIYDVNLFEKKAWQLKVIDDRGHQFFIQDLMDFDDIVRSSGKSATPKRSLVPQSNFATECNF